MLASNDKLSSHINATLALAWPLMGAQILRFSMVCVDNVMVGHLGAGPLAALAMASTLHNIFFLCAVGLLAALSPLIAQAYGAGKTPEIGKTIHQGLRLSVILSALMILGFLNSDGILILLGQDPTLTPLAQTYLTAIAWGIPAQVGYICLRQMTEASSDTRPSIVIAGAGALLNVFLDYVLIFGKFGFPALGVVGAGYTTAVISWLMLGALAFYIKFNRNYESFALFKAQKTDWVGLKELLRIGLPASGALLAEMSFFGACTLLMGTIGTRELASHQMAMNAIALVYMLPLGLSFAVGIRIGQRAGRKDREGVKHAWKAGLWITTWIQLAAAIVFLGFPELITSLYTKDKELIALASQLLRIAGIFQIFDGLQGVGMASLRALKDTRVPFVASLVSFWGIGVPLGYILTFELQVGPQGLWYGMVVGIGMAAVLHLIRFYLFTSITRLDFQPRTTG